jgi:hypothetical protein
MACQTALRETHEVNTDWGLRNDEAFLKGCRAALNVRND